MLSKSAKQAEHEKQEEVAKTPTNSKYPKQAKEHLLELADGSANARIERESSAELRAVSSQTDSALRDYNLVSNKVRLTDSELKILSALKG